MRPAALLYIYRRRLRAHAAQELLAGLGVAVAVALVFAVTVANSSIAGSAAQIVRTVVGPANLQLRARSGAGFSERLLEPVGDLRGVRHAAPLLEQPASIRDRNGRTVPIDLVGTGLSLAVLDGLAHTLPISTLAPGSIALTKTSARALGVSAAQVRTGESPSISLALRGQLHTLKVASVLGPEAIGALSQAQLAIMPLSRVQQLARLPGRITRIVVQTERGRQAAVHAGLLAIADGRLTVAPAEQDVNLLRQALRPSNQASTLFAAISALLGFLFAFNAMLLTAPERRRAIADLRLSGTRRTAIVQMVLFQALCLGVAASVVGLLAGYALSVGVLHQSPGYLAREFTLGTETVVGARPLLLALAAGVLAACLSSLVPLLDLRSGRAPDAVYFEDGEPGNALGGRMKPLLLGVVGLLLLAGGLFTFVASAAIVACVVLALATVLSVPLVFAGTLRSAGALAKRYERLTVLPVALASLRATALRSLALTATGAVALFGGVALGGSRGDLLKGIGEVSHNYAAAADIWVTSPDDNQATVEFTLDGGRIRRIAQIRGVAGVQTFQGGFFPLGNRQPWVIALPPGSSSTMLAGQMVNGREGTALARLQSGEWIMLSQQIADEYGVAPGDRFMLPTPTGDAHPRIAATTTNFAWPTGVIFMSTATFGRLWATSAPTALGVTLTPGTSVGPVRAAIKRVLGPKSGLEITTAQTRQTRIQASASEGLGQLREIALLLLLAAILSMAAALTSAVWQRRRSLADLRLCGVRPNRLRLILMTESLLLLCTGCLTGALAGVYGQTIIDGYLKNVSGFPVPRIATGLRPVELFALVVGVVFLAAVVPVWRASRVPAVFALEE